MPEPVAVAAGPLVAVMARVATCTIPTPCSEATTSSATELRASVTASDAATPTGPPATVPAAPIARARMRASSEAAMTTSWAVSRDVEVPETIACTFTWMRFSTSDPAPAAATATTPPEMATEIASTTASMDAVLLARTVTSPAAFTMLFAIVALTTAGALTAVRPSSR